MVSIKLSDGSKKNFSSPIKGYELAKNINSNLSKSAIAISVNGELKDLDFENIADSFQITNKFEDNNLLADLSTDDWPFFYMPVKTYPKSNLIMILFLLGTSVF